MYPLRLFFGCLLLPFFLLICAAGVIFVATAMGYEEARRSEV